MWIPPQGFRHAATLLLTNRLRGIPPQASATAATETLRRLAAELVSLCDDTRVPPEAREWVIEEYDRIVDRVTVPCDRERVKAEARIVLASIGAQSQDIEPRDLFLVYVAEDRMPVAAPLAIELTKRRLSVAFSDFEVAAGSDLTAVIARGLAHHRAGALVWTPHFTRACGDLPLQERDRFRILRGPLLPAGPADVDELASWVRRHI